MSKKCMSIVDWLSLPKEEADNYVAKCEPDEDGNDMVVWENKHDYECEVCHQVPQIIVGTSDTREPFFCVSCFLSQPVKMYLLPPYLQPPQKKMYHTGRVRTIDAFQTEDGEIFTNIQKAEEHQHKLVAKEGLDSWARNVLYSDMTASDVVKAIWDARRELVEILK